ncbi:MAG: YkgJ family cysteine cluster protein [Planctomycetota bacterium]|jgi:Fe-S-cluster containining protein
MTRPTDDSDSGPWYRGGLSFECTACGNCCSGPQTGHVWVTDHEIQNMSERLGMTDPEIFEQKFVRRVGSRKSLVEYSDGDCILLDPQSRHCLVYESRPSQCRTWPFWPSNLESPHAWGQAAKGCPGCNRGRLYTLEEIGLVVQAKSQT